MGCLWDRGKFEGTFLLALIRSQNHLGRTVSASSPPELKRPIFSVEAGGMSLHSTLENRALTNRNTVQTDNTVGTSTQRDHTIATKTRSHPTEDELAGLTAGDLSDVLKWSQVIAADINLASCASWYTLKRPAQLIPFSPSTSHRDRDWFVFAVLLPSFNLILHAENFNAQDAVLAMKTDEGEYTVATSCTSPQPCIVFEYARTN